MIRSWMEWGAIVDPERFNGWYRKERDRLSDMARDADWTGLFEELGRQPGPGRVNLPRIGNHPDRSGFAALHQAAWHGAPFAVVSRLIAHGAWRTQRARDGRHAVDVARDRGHTHLLQLLEPVVVRQLPSPPELERRFHSLLWERLGCCFEETEHLLPPLAPLTEGPAVEITFTVWGLMGGVTYRLEEDDVYVHIHSRMDADDGEHYRVTPDGWTKVRSPRLPPPLRPPGRTPRPDRRTGRTIRRRLVAVQGPRRRRPFRARRSPARPLGADGLAVARDDEHGHWTADSTMPLAEDALQYG